MSPRWLGGLLGAALVLGAPAAMADTPVALYQSFAGNVSFTGTTATMRTGKTVCDVSKGKLSKALAGIPAGAVVQSARLYWAGSSSTPDYQVTFENKAITAQRQFTSATNGYNYFGGVADVTAIVKAKGNGTYTFSNLSVSNGSPYCAVEGVMGGFALLVVYSDPAQPFRVLNVYEGFQYIRYSSLTLNLSNFKVPNPIGSATGRLGHITWEGDLSLNQQGENLSFNGTVMTDALNPEGNQFNSKSNVNGDTASYGIDFDAYTVAAPIIQPGQTAATTVYSSGQDLVLLTAEVVAVPNVPVADLGITMTRTGEAYQGMNLSYALTVKNSGPNDADGPVTVTDYLPTGTSFVSAGGTGWTCSASGSTVTCTYNGSVANLAALPTISIVARVVTGGLSYTNKATVSGPTFDNATGNNTAIDTTGDSALAGAYALTLDVCADGALVGATDCRLFTGMDAGAGQAAYITALNPADPSRAKALSNSNTNKSLSLSISCVNPVQHAGVRASFGGVQFPLCASNGATPAAGAADWIGPYSITFTGKTASSASPYMFQYKDVGLVQFNVQEKSGSTYLYGRTQVIVQPATLKLQVSRASDGLLNPGGSLGFAAAGEPLTVVVTALATDNTPTPNFGKEVVAEDVKLEFQPTSGEAGLLEGTFAAASAGAYSGTFTYSEGGSILLKASMNADAGDYLASARPVGSATATVGSFYPAYLGTAPTAPFDCLPRMGCPSGTLPSGEDLGVNGAVYSEQAFEVIVTPYNAKDAPIKNFTPSANVQLSAVTQPGQTGVVSTAGGFPSASAPSLQQYPSFTLPNRYDSTAPVGTANWTTPRTIYLRAVTQVPVAPSGTKAIFSLLPAGKKSIEGGIQVVSGRLRVANSAGSELLRLPVRVNAQYWSTGNTWDNNTGDDSSQFAYNSGGGLGRSNCTRTLLVGGSCSTLVQAEDWGTATLSDGGARFWMRPPGAGNTGSVDLTILGGPAHLPSTVGRATFGVYRSPLIYIREVY